MLAEELQEAMKVDDACDASRPGSCELSLMQRRTSGSCASYGCKNTYRRGQTCQCNAKCEAHGNCCTDYRFKCTASKPLARAPGRPKEAPRRLIFVNKCAKEPLWIAHMAAGKVGPDPQDVKIEPGQSHAFSTPSQLSATRYWPKMGCDESGHNCSIGSSGGPGEACKRNPITGEDDYSRCAPPVDTKFEASFGENGEPCNPKAPGGTEMKGCDFVDMSLVDGWTLPFIFEAKGDCKTNKDEIVESINCSGLTLDACPDLEALTDMSADLRAINPITKQVSGCYSPCSKLLDTKWSNKELAHGRKAEQDDVNPYCCPTPPQTPESCRAGPITKTKFLKTVHEKCPGVYGYAYDDGMGLMRCASATIYTVSFYCPSELPVKPMVRIPV